MIAMKLYNQLKTDSNEVIKEYNRLYTEVHKYDLKTSDLLHKIEFKNFNNLFVIFEEIKVCRTERRKVKDELRVLAPLYNYVKDNNNKLCIMQQEMNRQQSLLSKRKYACRIGGEVIANENC